MNVPIVEESNVQLLINGTRAFSWRCTPTDLEALVVGRLYIEGMISTADSVNLVIDRKGDFDIEIAARLDGPTAITDAHSAGEFALPGADAFADLFRALFAGVDARHEHGGMHATAATDGQRIIKQVEDVGRHNTIDKIAGALLLHNLAPHTMGLVTSSRVSGEIAAKAARAGFRWLASRSIPTTLAVSIAQQARLPIIGRAASRNASIYS